MLWDQQRVPGPRPASAPPAEFSAQRAMEHVRAIAGDTRFLGSPNHAATREYLLAQLRSLGLRPTLQRAAVVNTFTGSDEPEAGSVTNVIARIPGTASTGMIALNAHYDSGPGGPGASDCGSCVATVLEAARALLAGPRLRNDVLLVFTDGEENGDLGAAAFAGQHPLMREVAVVLNWETAGSHGPALLMAGNSSALVQDVLDATPNARTYSVLPSLFRGALKAQQLATDTQEYMDRGASGVQFAYLRGTRDYHTVRDSPAHLGRGSLQMDGDYAVAATRKLGDEPLERATTDRSTYFNVTGGVIVQYGPAVTLALGLLTLALFIGSVLAGRRTGRVSLPAVLAGALVFPVTVLLASAVSTIAWIGLKAVVPDLALFTLGTSQNALFVFGLVCLAFAAFAALYHPLLQRARPDALALGALAWWVLLAVAFSVMAPSAAYLFTLPTLAALGVTFWRLTGSRPARWQAAVGVAVPVAVLSVVYAPVMLVFSLLTLRLDGLGLPVVGLMGLFAVLAAGLMVPHLAPRVALRREHPARAGLLPGAAALTAVLLLSVGALRLSYDTENPRPDVVSYVLDADTGKASWETGDRASWSAALVKGGVPADIELAPFSTVRGWRAPAPALSLAAPLVTEMSRSTRTTTTTLRLRISSPRGADALAVHLRAPGAITAASVEGRRLPATASLRRGELKLPYVGVPRRGITLEVTVRGRGTLRATVRDYTQGLPARAGAPERPADTMPAAITFRADPTVIVRRSEVTL